jgi:hypothetical protein
MPSTKSVQCNVPGVGVALRDALCKGSASEIREVLFRADSKPFEASHTHLLEVIKRLWVRDRSYGKELPWPALESVWVRAVFVDYLAQGVRNAEIEGSLVDMQSVALEMIRSAKRDSDQLEGLRLLGITDAQDQVPLLRSTALSTEVPMLWRRNAIEALGYICAAQAAAALQEIESMAGEKNVELKQIVARAQMTRERLRTSWCRYSGI